MLQQIIALIVIVFFLSRLFWQKKKNQINASEFSFWLIFWVLAAIAILALRQLDRLAVSLGFSSSGIDILLYIGIVMLFYFIFRLRLRLARAERDITKIVREIALKNK